MKLLFRKKQNPEAPLHCRYCDKPMRQWGWICGEAFWCCSSGNLCGEPGSGWDAIKDDPWQSILLCWILTSKWHSASEAKIA